MSNPGWLMVSTCTACRDDEHDFDGVFSLTEKPYCICCGKPRD